MTLNSLNFCNSLCVIEIKADDLHFLYMISCFIQIEGKRTAIFFVKRCCVWICLYEELITVYYFKGGYIIYINIWRKCSPLIVVLFICLVFFVPLIFTHMDIWRNYVHFIYELNTTWQFKCKSCPPFLTPSKPDVIFLYGYI